MSLSRVEERRTHVRYSFKAKARLTLPKGSISGYLNDMSMGGVLLLLESGISQEDINSKGEIVIYCGEDTIIKATCKIVRLHEGGAGLCFSQWMKISVTHLSKSLTAWNKWLMRVLRNRPDKQACSD